MATDNIKFANDNYANMVLLVLILLVPSVAYAQEFDLQNIQNNLQAIITFAIATSYVMGLFFCFYAVLKLKQYGERSTMQPGQGSLGRSVALFVIGIMLLYLPSTMSVFSYTVWNTTDPKLFPRPGSAGEFFDVFKTLILAIRVAGIISFIRGWVLLVQVANEKGQPGTVGKAILHLLGGVLAFNFMQLYETIENSLFA